MGVGADEGDGSGLAAPAEWDDEPAGPSDRAVPIEDDPEGNGQTLHALGLAAECGNTGNRVPTRRLGAVGQRTNLQRTNRAKSHVDEEKAAAHGPATVLQSCRFVSSRGHVTDLQKQTMG